MLSIFTNPFFANGDDLVVDVTKKKFESATLSLIGALSRYSRKTDTFFKINYLLLRFSFVKNYIKEITNLIKKVTQKLTF